MPFTFTFTLPIFQSRGLTALLTLTCFTFIIVHVAIIHTLRLTFARIPNSISPRISMQYVDARFPSRWVLVHSYFPIFQPLWYPGVSR